MSEFDFSTTMATTTTELMVRNGGESRLCPADRTDPTPAPTISCGGSPQKSETEFYVGYYFFLTAALGMLVGIHLLAIVFNRQRLEYWKDRDWSQHHMHGKNNSATFWMGIALFVTYAANMYSIINTNLRMSVIVAGYCDQAYSLLYFGVILAKFGNYSFFLMRAQLTGALNQEKTKYVIGFLLFYLLFACVMIGILNIPGKCVVNDNTCRRLCLWSSNDFNALEQSMIALFVTVDMIATIFFTYIFGASYYRVVNSENVQGALHEAQQHTRKRDTAIRINFLLSVIAMVSTTIFAVLFLNVKPVANLFPTDFLLNSACLFFMLASNRRLSIYMFCCCKWSNQYQLMREDIGREIDKTATRLEDGPPSISSRGRTVSVTAIGIEKQGIWYLKSQLFYTWLAYLLCPCDRKCYIFVWPREWTRKWECCDRCCSKRQKERDAVLRHLFQQFDFEERGRKAKKQVSQKVREKEVELGIIDENNNIGSSKATNQVLRADTLESVAGFAKGYRDHQTSVDSNSSVPQTPDS